MDISMSSMSMPSSSAAIHSASHTMSSMGSAPSGHDHASMSMNGMGGGCKISMLWNWYTVNACFISKSWQIKSSGMFAGSCIGVILLVMLGEFVRRATIEYDAYLIRQQTTSLVLQQQVRVTETPSGSASISPGDEKHSAVGTGSPTTSAPFTRILQSGRPTLPQQAIRALLHVCLYAISYLAMLLAMYYNGYIIISIFIGAFLGYFVFNWRVLGGTT